MSILLLALGLILFVGLVVVHEFGHFIMARRGGVEVEEFGIGFPPRLYGRNFKNNQTPWAIAWQGFLNLISFGGPLGEKKLTNKDIPDSKKTVYTINLLPLGGFVKLKGENDADKSPGSFGAASLSTKVKIMLAGVVMNLVTAFVILTALAAIGMPKLIDNQFTVASDTKIVKNDVLVGFVEPDSPAAKAGVKERDKLTGIGLQPGCETQQFEAFLCDAKTEPITSSARLTELTKINSGKEVPIYVERKGEILELPATLRTVEEVEASKKTDNPKGYLGISPAEYIVQRSTWSAPIVAAGFIKQVTELTFKGLGTAIGSLFQGDTAKASSQVAGPVGIFVLLKDGSLLGYQFILMIIAIISLTLAIMNVLPIPALDGGRLFVTLLFRAVRKPLKEKTENLIHGTGFALLMLLFVLITIVDVKRFF